MTSASKSPMNKICKFILCTCLAVVYHAQAQDDGTVGYFRLANATGLDGALHFYMDGEDLNPKGYVSGETTGSLGVGVPTVKLRATHPLCEDTEYELKLQPGLQTAVIVYVEPQVDQKTGEVKKRELKFSTLERKSGGSRKKSATLLFLSVSQSIDLDMNGKPITLKALKQLDVGFGDSSSTAVNIAVGKTSIGNLDIEEAGDYAVIVFDKADGTHGCITFYNTRH